MVLTVLAWVLRAAAAIVMAFSYAGFGRGRLLGRTGDALPRETRSLRVRVFRGATFLALAVGLWLLAGVLEGDMEAGFAILMGAAGAAGVVSGVLRRDVKRRLPPRPPDHLNAVQIVSWILLFVGIGGGGILSERVTDRTLRGLLWGAVFFGIFAGGTFIAWAVARLWLRFRRSPTAQP